MSPQTPHAASHLGLTELELARAMYGENAQLARMCGRALAQYLVALGTLRRTFCNRAIRVELDGKVERAVVMPGQVGLLGPGANLQILNLPIAQALVLVEPMSGKVSGLRFFDEQGNTTFAGRRIDPVRLEPNFSMGRWDRGYIRTSLPCGPGPLPLDSVRTILDFLKERSLVTTLRVETRCGTLLHRSRPLSFSESDGAWELSFENLQITINRDVFSEGIMRRNPDNQLEPWCVDVLDGCGEPVLTCSVPRSALDFLI